MENIILKHLDQTATKEEMKALLDWLEESEENQKQFASIRDLWLASRATLSFVNGESGKAFRLFRNNALKFEERRRRKIIDGSMLKIAAAVALLVICSIGSYITGKKNTLPTTQVVRVMMNQTIMGQGHKGSVTLPDGTVVWLNSNSKLIYPDKFEESTRSVKLEGEGYFEVTSNKDAPFYVETTDMTVKVLGTHFDVRSYERKNAFEAVLLSGKVEVQMKKNGEKLILAPNEKFSFDKQTNSYGVEKVNASDYTLWTAEKLIFEDESLSAIFKKMERWYDIDISCQKNVPLNARYSLTVRNEPMEEILKMLSIIAQIEYTIKDDKIIIHAK